MIETLPDRPNPTRTALNRVTFGARLPEVSEVEAAGWANWVDQQLRPPFGDETRITDYLRSRSMHIQYAIQLPAGKSPGWPAVDQRRSLNYLNADLPAIWEMVSKTEISIAPNERTRIQQEFNAATWIRNTHSRYQLREFMADFWNSHFNVGRQEDIYAAAAVPTFDADVIRPHVFGNFAKLLEAVATSAAMLRYLNNAASETVRPTENYVRELMELHTLGGNAYSGVSHRTISRSIKVAGQLVASTFSDRDVVQAAKAFSGWTLEHGQPGPEGPLPFTGHFIFNPVQHDDSAGEFMGIDLAHFKGPMRQGRMILGILANHPVTASFVCGKLCRRIFGDDPSEDVVARATRVWLKNRAAPDQIAQVLHVILLSDEIHQPAAKVRRPYERIIALFRTTDTTVSAYDRAYDALSSLGDGLNAWPTPEGRPDTDAYWLSRATNLEYWNLMFKLLDHPSFHTTFAEQTPDDAAATPEGVVSFWVNRMVGHALRPAGMAALISDVQGPIGVMAAYRSRGITNIENSLRRLAVLIATSPEFAVR